MRKSSLLPAMLPALRVSHSLIRSKTLTIYSTFGFIWMITSLGCAGKHQLVSSSRSHQDIAEITKVLDRQVQNWNRGDIDAFMQGYWQSPHLSFSSSGSVTRGWQQTLDNYHSRYSNRQAMGHLAFSDLEMSALGLNDFLVLGSWNLAREKPIGGAFTLVFRRINHQWQIIHDHTSAIPSLMPSDRSTD